MNQTVVLPSGAIISCLQSNSTEDSRQAVPPEASAPSMGDLPITNVNGFKNGPLKSPSKRKLKEDDELVVLKSNVSLMDCVSRDRISYCARTSKCSHVGCFDFNSFKLYNPTAGVIFDRAGQNNKEIRYEYNDVIESNEVVGFRLIAKSQKDNKFNVSNRKFTRKTANYQVFKCPLCDIDFLPNELIFDDFMHVIVNHPLLKNVKQIQVDDDWLVIPIKEEDKINGEIVSLSDDEDNRKRRKRNRRIRINTVIDDEDNDNDNNNNGMTDSLQVIERDDSYNDDFTVFLPNGTEEDPVVLD